jgi:hypothetical protein
MKFSLLLACLSVHFSVISQKPPVDFTTFYRWPSYSSTDISNDGNYCGFIISGLPEQSRSLLLYGITGHFQLQFINAHEFSFTANSKNAIFLCGKDSLCIVTLSSMATRYIPNVATYKLSTDSGPGYLAYQLNNTQKEVVVLNLETDDERHFTDITDYEFNGQGTVLLLQKDGNANDEKLLEWYDLLHRDVKIVWRGREARNFIFDISGKQLAFIASIDTTEHSGIWYYKPFLKEAKCIAGKMPIKDEMKLTTIKGFNFNGTRLYFYVEVPKLFTQVKSGYAAPDVWNYKDSKLQSQQLKSLSNDRHQFACVVNVQDIAIIRLEGLNENVIFPPDELFHKYNDENLLLQQSGNGDTWHEWNWNETARSSVYLVSTKNGSKHLISKNLFIGTANKYSLSSNGKYIVYYSPEQSNYFCYSIESGAVRNLTKNLNASWTTLYRDDEPKSSYNTVGVGIAGWDNNGETVFLYEQNDIIMVDLTGKKPPVNITNGYGKAHGIVFRFIKDKQDELINYSRNVLLSAFDLSNMDDGFYTVKITEHANPQKLTMKPYLFTGVPEMGKRGELLKAGNAEVFLIKRMSSDEFPNYFLTTNFRNFVPITNIYPEKNYNWIKAELVTWNISKTKIGKGILYKPENFDANKKYPIIFTYYERSSYGLHDFLRPGFSNANINIPYYVSKGYLVFMPDIVFTIGHPGKSAYEAIVTAGEYMAKMPWVEPQRMGLQGHSFAGFHTNYIITHSTLFSAAVSAAGMSDFISIYGSIIGDGSSRQRQYELYRDRIGGTLWDKKELYIENSPVLNLDKVVTPILMMANKSDHDVPFFQSIEFFTGLRRLKKSAWMLQYDDQDHVLADQNAAADFTIRMKQFFDHYLKGAPPPKWMSVGIPARLKGIETGYELDPNGSCGKDCKICKEKKYKNQ